MKKVILWSYYAILSLFFISCTPKKTVRVIHAKNMSIPKIYSWDSRIYLCAKYTFVYWNGGDSIEEIETCTCNNTLVQLLEWEANRYSEPNRFITYTLIIWDTNFVVNHVLPLIREEEDRKKIKYTLANSNDSTFNNIIDFNNKVIINDKMYYYPINVKACISITSVDYEWFKTIVPQSSWIYVPYCFGDEKKMQIRLLIPLLGECTMWNKKKINY